MAQIKLTVDENSCGIRLDAYISDNCELSRTQIQKLIKDNKISVLDKTIRNSYKTELNDVITIEYEEETETDILPADIPIDIVYEDDQLLVINKQKGLVVHPAPGNYNNTLVNALLFKNKELSDVNGSYRPGIVHRIDKDTSGLLVVAKTNAAHQFLSEQLADKRCFRKYYALVSGVIQNNEGEINAPIGRSDKDRQKMAVTEKNSKPAVTEFKVLERYGDSTFVECNLLTGRTHQIRVHMAFIHHPVINDSRYSRKTIDESGQYLHAYYLSFIHPTTKERVEFTTDIPEYMKQYIKEHGGKYEK